jgi:hypothetical protein
MHELLFALTSSFFLLLSFNLFFFIELLHPLLMFFVPQSSHLNLLSILLTLHNSLLRQVGWTLAKERRLHWLS